MVGVVIVLLPALAFGEVNGETYFAAGNSASLIPSSGVFRFAVAGFDGSSFNNGALGGEGWGETVSTTGLATAVVGNFLYLAVSRYSDTNDRLIVYRIVTTELAKK